MTDSSTTPSRLLRSNVAVAAGTALSRISGLLRVATLGFVLGRTALTDAYNQANATPNLIYELLLGGVLSATLVPLFTRLDHDRDEEGATAVISVSVVVLAGLTIIAVAAAPLVFRMYSWLSSSNVDTAQYRRVGQLLAAIFLVQIFFYGVNALMSARLQARGRYFAAAWVPALSNVIIIGGLLLVPRIMRTTPALGDVLTNDRLRWTLGLGATAGIAAMALALVPASRRAGLPLRFRPNFSHPAVRQLRSLSGWALGYVIFNQVAILVVQNLLLRSGSGNQSAYTNAFTFFTLPHGLLAMSIATTFLPAMSRLAKERDRAGFIDRASLGIRLVALLTIPAGFGLFALRRPIIGLALQHFHFSAADALSTSRALAGFALGLGGFSIYLFVLRAFYAHQDARTPFVINAVENAINIVLAVMLVDRFGVLGLGASFAVAYIVSAALALQVLGYKVAGFPVRAVVASILRMLIASAVMAEAVWLVGRAIGDNDGLGALARVGCAVVVGLAVYVGLLTAMGSVEIDQLKRNLRRAPGVPPTS